MISIEKLQINNIQNDKIINKYINKKIVKWDNQVFKLNICVN